jgi:hypothetical protein
MSDLDRLAQRHAEVLRESVADAERPELIPPQQTHTLRRGLIIAAAAAVVSVAVIAPLAWRPTQTPPVPVQTTPGDTVITTIETTATTSTVTTSSGVSTQTVFDIERFASAMLDGAFGDDENRIGMVVLVPATADITELLSELTELEDYRYVSPEVVAEFASGYAERRRMEPLQRSWQAYGLIPEYSGTPVWDWETSVREIPDAVFVTRLDVENPKIRVPEGWSILTDIGFDVPSGSIMVATNDGLVIITAAATTVIDADGFIRDGEPSPAPIPDSCCGDANAYSYGSGVMLLYRGEGAWLLDFASISWREIDPLPSDAYPVGTALYPLGMAQIGDQLYVVAGAPRTVNTSSEVAALDLATGTWRIVDPVPAPITVGGVTADGIRLIVAGTHQDTNNRVIGDRNPVVYAYTEAAAWIQLPNISIDGQASTITWVDGVGLLAWNYDQESALLDESGTWRNLDEVPMDFSECLPISVPIDSGAAGHCGGLAWFDGESAIWSAIDAPRNGQFALGNATAYAIVTAAGNTTVLQYPLPPVN